MSDFLEALGFDIKEDEEAVDRCVKERTSYDQLPISSQVVVGKHLIVEKHKMEKAIKATYNALSDTIIENKMLTKKNKNLEDLVGKYTISDPKLFNEHIKLYNNSKMSTLVENSPEEIASDIQHILLKKLKEVNTKY